MPHLDKHSQSRFCGADTILVMKIWCQWSCVLFFLLFFFLLLQITRQKVKSMVKLASGGLVIHGANPSSLTYFINMTLND